MENVPTSTQNNYVSTLLSLKMVLPSMPHPNNGVVVNKKGIDVDNRFVVPHNVDLVVKFQAHINVERVNRDRMRKYLFKYVTKGFDCARIGIQRGPSSVDQSIDTVNEIDNFLECHCVTPNDGAWRLVQYDIHYTDPSVESLPVHLPFENNVVFTEGDDFKEVLENPDNVRTKLTSWWRPITVMLLQETTLTLNFQSISHAMQMVSCDTLCI
jgi:hypothetical protein